jgi:peptide/nickel transport system ATP-binding protein
MQLPDAERSAASFPHQFSGGQCQRRSSNGTVQIIFQDPFGSLNPRRRVLSSITRAAVLGGLGRRGAKARAVELLRRVGFSADALQRRPAAFAGGQRQRSGTARAGHEAGHSGRG